MSGTYATPGTYVAEVPFAIRVMDSLPSGVAAFVGTAMRGPQNEPTLVNGFDGFREKFGDLDPSSDMSYAVEQFFGNGGRVALIVRVECPPDAVAGVSEIVGSEERKTGLHALGPYDLFDVLVVPNRSEPEVHAAMVGLARESAAFAILDLPESVGDPAAAQAWLGANEALRSQSAAAYFPRVICKDRSQGGRLRSFANSGLIAGLYARIDGAKGVWEPPAGPIATLNGVNRVVYNVSEREIASLNSRGLNLLRFAPRVWPGVGAKRPLVVRGVRTLGIPGEGLRDGEYIPVSRLVSFLTRNLNQALWGLDYRQNSKTLCEEVRVQVDLYMRRLFLQGAFRGAAPNRAYTVSCSPGDKDDVLITIGFAPVEGTYSIVSNCRGAVSLGCKGLKRNIPALRGGSARNTRVEAASRLDDRKAGADKSGS